MGEEETSVPISSDQGRPSGQRGVWRNIYFEIPVMPPGATRALRALSAAAGRQPSVIGAACCILLKCTIKELMGLWGKLKGIFGVFLCFKI